MEKKLLKRDEDEKAEIENREKSKAAKLANQEEKRLQEIRDKENANPNSANTNVDSTANINEAIFDECCNALWDEMDSQQTAKSSSNSNNSNNDAIG